MLPPSTSSGEPLVNPAPASSPTLHNFGIKRWQFWLGILLSLVFLYLALRNVTLSETLDTMRKAKIFFLGAAVASYLFSVVAKSARWRLLLSAHKTPGFGRTFSIFSVGQMINTFLPAPLGELVRSYMLGEAEADSKIYVLGTVAVERIADMFFLLLSLIFLLGQMPFPDWLASPARGTEIVLIILVPCFIFVAWQKDLVIRILEWTIRFVPLKWREWLLREAHYAVDSLDSVRRPRLLISLIFWSLVICFFSAFTNYLVFLAIGIKLPFWAALLVVVVLQVGTQIPSSPGGVGIFQYVTILTLGLFGIEKTLALGYSLLLYLVVSLPIVVIGGYGLWHERFAWQDLQKAFSTLSRLKSRSRSRLT